MKKSSQKIGSKRHLIQKSSLRHSIYLESYGVKIRIASNEAEATETIQDLLPAILADRCRMIDPEATDHEFFYRWNKSGYDSFYKNGEIIVARRERGKALDRLNSEIRLTVAEFAVERVFLHAGVVGWNGKAIIMPAKSFRGKSTLTAELVRRGAIYYSDEYAVLDSNGLVSPFPKMLSIRGEVDNNTQIDYPVETFGGTAGKESIEVAMVLITEYKPKATWAPKILSSGQGVLEMIKDTVPIRNDPTFTLAVLNKVAKNALIVTSRRGDAVEFAERILDFFDSNCA